MENDCRFENGYNNSKIHKKKKNKYKRWKPKKDKQKQTDTPCNSNILQTDGWLPVINVYYKTAFVIFTPFYHQR